ncbi:MAG: hypothetical protein IKT42_04255 [Clostridia bacterium]|nr:hypothetical protein [Clostridia bacterium]
MKKTVELPLIEPMYATYHNGIVTACLADNITLRNAYLNEVGILVCNKKFLTGYTSPEINVEGTEIDDAFFLTKQWISMLPLKSQLNAVIRNLIDDGFYVHYSGVDDYFMDGKSWYEERHFSHDGTICGYNQEDKTFCIYAYDKDWVYRKFWVPQKSFDAGRKYAFEHGVNGSIWGMKPKGEKIEFSASKALILIKDYLDSNIKKYPEKGDGNVRGIVVHKYIVKYLDKLCDGSIPYEKMDWRVFRMIWEHKKVMLERIKCIENQLGMNSEISDEYKNIVDAANKMRMMYALLQTKKRESILQSLQIKLIILSDGEYKILKDLLKKVKKLV